VPSLRIFLGSFWGPVSYVAIAFATFFFDASLTPSLLPRHFAVQGLLSGIALAVGYGAGAFAFGSGTTLNYLSRMPRRSA
jgi:uncharacterized membrane protein